MTVSSNVSFFGVSKISASTFDELNNAPLNIALEGEDWERGSASLTIHTYDRELTDAIVSAINCAVSAINAKRAVLETAPA